MISKEKYFEAREIVTQYRIEQNNFKKYKGKSKCPFCSGSKITPFVALKSQDCNECDKNGFIENKKLINYGLDEYINMESIK